MSQEVDHGGDPIGLQLRIARVRTGRKQYEVAAKVGVSGTVLSRIETGEREPDPDLLARLWAELGVEAEAVA